MTWGTSSQSPINNVTSPYLEFYLQWLQKLNMFSRQAASKQSGRQTRPSATGDIYGLKIKRNLWMACQRKITTINHPSIAIFNKGIKNREWWRQSLAQRARLEGTFVKIRRALFLKRRHSNYGRFTKSWADGNHTLMVRILQPPCWVVWKLDLR